MSLEGDGTPRECFVSVQRGVESAGLLAERGWIVADLKRHGDFRHYDPNPRLLCCVSGRTAPYGGNYPHVILCCVKGTVRGLAKCYAQRKDLHERIKQGAYGVARAAQVTSSSFLC